MDIKLGVDSFAFAERLSTRAERCLFNEFYRSPCIYDADATAIHLFCLELHKPEYGVNPIYPEAVAVLHEAQLLRIPNFGRESLREVKEALAFFGLKPGMDPKGIFDRLRDKSLGWEWNLMEAAA